jgi:hypothetical protein
MQNILSRFWDPVTNTSNNGFWIGWFDLLALLLQLLLITINYNSSQSMTAKTHSTPYWTTSVFSSIVIDLVLIYELVTSSVSVVCWFEHSITTAIWLTSLLQMTYKSITCPPFTPQCKTNIKHYFQQFRLFRVYPLLCKHELIPWHAKCCLANRVLASRCLAMNVCSDFTIPAFSHHVTIYT